MNEIQYTYENKTLLEQFNIFCDTNKPANFEIAIEFFTVFGGLNRQIDCQKDLKSQIEIHILKRYKYLRNDIAAISKGSNDAHKVLSALALGDRRTNSAFKRCKISFDDGINIVDDQCKIGMLKLEKTFQRFTNKQKNMDISEKLIFTTPFAHYWFACVSPIFKGVRDGDFKESLDRFFNKQAELTSFVYEQLSHEMIKVIYKDDEVKQLGRYWDNSGDIVNLLAKTKSGKIIAGNITYSNSKIKKSSYNNLKRTCTDLGIKADVFVMFCKKGFTSELKSLKSDKVKLYTMKNLNILCSLDK